jgi:hypothetical protein
MSVRSIMLNGGFRGKPRLEAYLKEFEGISEPGDFEAFLLGIFRHCRDYLKRKTNIVPYPRVILDLIHSEKEFSQLQKDYEERYGEKPSDMAFIDCLNRSVLGHDIIYINVKSHFGNKPELSSIVDLCVSYFEELIHSSDPSKPETKTVELVFCTVEGFLGIELSEETKLKAVKRATLVDEDRDRPPPAGNT